jgi:hypothetical protein
MRFPIKITENFLLEPIMKVFGAGPAQSFVELGEDSFEVQMGIWFHETFPLPVVSAMGPSEWPWWGGLGVKLHHHGIGVVGSTDNVVNVKFTTPQKATAVVRVDCSQLWISLVDREGFLRELSGRTKVAISEHLPF